MITKVIVAGKKLYYNRTICNSVNEIKCAWKMINKEKGTTKQDIGMQALMLNKLIRNLKKWQKPSITISYL
jgi:hypothetical protein